ncbi:MAG: hypothetical protein KatS3mg082_0887 [Nitrospiraceae bacterium]|nr:MAG: hypothetical protein KatS3mg082_0887 [Nitrospiraceae bacterium]
MFGNGHTFYHPVYIDNLVDAFELAAATEGIRGSTYIIADERYYTLNELVRQVGKAMGIDVRIRRVPFWPLWLAAFATEMACKPLRITPPLFRRRVDWFRQVRAFSIDKAKKELGYQPKVGLEGRSCPDRPMVPGTRVYLSGGTETHVRHCRILLAG